MNRALVAALLLTFTLPAQDVVHYKFDEAAGLNTVNYAAHTGLAAPEATITSTDTSAFAPGRFGPTSLRGSATGGTAFHSYADTGFVGTFSGSFTLAFFLKQRTSITGARYFCGNIQSGSFRCFTGGAAGLGIRVTSAGTTPLNLDMTTDITTPSQTRWVHVALVVDSTAMTAVWYLDGLPNTTIPLSVAPNVTSTSTFRVGAQNGGLTASPFDLDDFRFNLSAASPTEILGWSQRTVAADGQYGRGCGATLSSANAPPAIGSVNYRIDLQATTPGPFAISLGTSRTMFNSLPLPFDLGLLFPGMNGCPWESDFALVIPGSTSATGAGVLPLPIPNNPTFEGFTLWCQAFVVAGSVPLSSNGLAVSLGF